MYMVFTSQNGIHCILYVHMQYKVHRYELISHTGGLSVAIPGEIRGFWRAWTEFGNLEWSELFQPAIQIATEGIEISKTVATAIEGVEEYVLSGNYSGLE